MSQPDHTRTTRAVYDATAGDYARVIGVDISSAFEGPIDRAVLSAFAELTTPGPVVDVGCGPGRAAAFLAERSVEVVGVDASSGMLEIARRAHPTLAVAQSLLTALPIADRSVKGIVAWYSIIHTPPRLLDAAVRELARPVRTGGEVLIAFQAGDGAAVVRPDAHGTGITLTSYRHDPDDVRLRMIGAGLDVHTRVVRDAMLPSETTDQAFLMARRA